MTDEPAGLLREPTKPSTLGVVLRVLWWPMFVAIALGADGPKATFAVIAMGLIGVLKEGQIHAGKMVAHYAALNRSQRDRQRT